MRKRRKIRHKIEVLHRPGLSMTDEEALNFIRGLRAVAVCCFEDMPEYQCLVEDRASLCDKVIAVARRPDRSIGAFCSALLIPVEGIDDVLHMGLTCVHPDDRSMGLTHKLSFRLLSSHLLFHRKMRGFWISNAACVLSSLGNIALNFDHVHPSPFNLAPATDVHRAIAEAIDQNYRDEIAINEDAVFDEEAFVFRGSVKGTSFQKTADDRRYHHRIDALNQFYLDRLRMNEGDEILQVGHISMRTVLWYLRRRSRRVAQPDHAFADMAI